MKRTRRIREVIATTGLMALATAGPAQALTGICPDGSMYIVQHAAQIPCPASKQVEPHEVPPMRPEYRPTPYTWDVWNRGADPNNPYNVIDAARQVREFQQALPGEGTPTAPGLAATPGVAQAAPTGIQTDPAAVRPLDLGLSDQDLRDLYQIVQLSQDHAPAHLARRTADEKGIFEVAWAHSAAFEGTLKRLWSTRGGLGSGPVLLFTGQSKRPEEFFANFTVLQGHLSFQPDAGDPRQLGILQGRLGALGAGEVVMGYVVLPEAMGLEQELDLYWNDRRIRAHLGTQRAAQHVPETRGDR